MDFISTLMCKWLLVCNAVPGGIRGVTHFLHTIELYDIFEAK